MGFKSLVKNIINYNAIPTGWKEINFQLTIPKLQTNSNDQFQKYQTYILKIVILILGFI